VRRWVQSAQAQQKTTLEMKQAQEVKQVLIPEAVPQIPGFPSSLSTSLPAPSMV